MLKFLETQVTFSEVPDEVSLCINITGCKNNCIGCHSPQLAEDIGTLLTNDTLDLLINGNKGITCISFMGGDHDTKEISNLAHYVKKYYPKMKICWYSGLDFIDKYIEHNLFNFDYIKIGSYKKKFGPLNSRTTNQRMLKVIHTSKGINKLIDITYKFLKNNETDN